jgi:hypothetical protein
VSATEISAGKLAEEKEVLMTIASKLDQLYDVDAMAAELDRLQGRCLKLQADVGLLEAEVCFLQRRVERIMADHQDAFSLLHGTLDKFPKTADGVTAIPGEPLFWLDDTGTTPRILEVEIYSSAMGLAKECYSTRELAEVAKAEKTKGGLE